MSSEDCASGSAMGQGKKTSSEIVLRLLSALVMVVVSISLTYLGGWYFSALVMVGSAVLCWEWWRIAGAGSSWSALVINCATLLAGVGAMSLGHYFIALAMLAFSFVVSVVVALWAGQRIWAAFGQIYIGLPVLAILWFRADVSFGFLSVLFLFLVVWTADSAAYFAGRGIGGPKLWERVSPNKTWAGFIGGVFASAVVGLIFGWVCDLPDLIALCGLSVLLAVSAQGGDLLESSIKRTFDVKDASQVIPGHGGVFDRVDGLIAALVVAGLIALLKDGAEPARALLFWS